MVKLLSGSCTLTNLLFFYGTKKCIRRLFFVSLIIVPGAFIAPAIASTLDQCEWNMAVADVSSTISGNHCPEFLPPFNANCEAYNPGTTEVIFKVTKELSSTSTWNFDFSINGINVTVYDLALAGNSSMPVISSGDDTAGTLNAGDNTEITFTYRIYNVPGTSLDVVFEVSGGSDGMCGETGLTDDNNITHIINLMPTVGNFN